MGIKAVKIQLYNKSRTKAEVLNKFGDYILDDICISCTVEENLSTTEYFLDAEFYVDNNGLYKCLEEDAILKVQIDYGEEIFSIVDIKKSPTRVIVFARQITITESICSWMDDVRPEEKNGQDALAHMGQNAVGPHNLEFESDIDKTNTAYFQQQTLYDAIHISDNCFAIRWGGEVKRRGYKIIINEKLGEDRNVQIRSGKNLVGFEANTNIDSIVTRIKPIGYNGITTNGYVDSPLINNYKYIRTQTMKYENIKLASDVEEGTNTEDGDLIYDTLEEAQQKLTELALLEFLDSIDTIQAEYTINFVDLSTTEEYKNYAQAELILLGDLIHVYEEKHDINIIVRAISRKYNILAQKVIEITLSNKATESEQAETIESLKSRLDEVVESVGYMKVTYATVEELDVTNAEVENLEAVKANVSDLEAINASIDELVVNKAYVSDLAATNLIVESLKAGKVDIAELDAVSAEIENLKTTKADVTALEAAIADIDVLVADVADIETLVNGNLTSDNIQSLILTSDKVTVDNGFIKNAMIDSLSANKITTGTINTSLVSVQSSDGSLSLSGNLIQVKDDDDDVRIQIGKDTSGDFTFILYGENGQGQLINQDGITASAISDGLIVNKMVADNAAISGSKLDINSVIKTINDNGTETINSSRIYLNDQDQTLQVAFNSLQDQVEVLEVTNGDLTNVVTQVQTNTTNIEVAQGQIESLISNTTITKEDGSVVQLKDDYNNTVSTVDSHTQTIASVQTDYNSLDEEVESLDVRLTTLRLDSNSISTSIQNVTTTIDTLNEDVTVLSNQVAAAMTSEEVTLQIQSEISSLSIGEVTTSTGYTFNEEGLTIEKSDSEMSTQITEDGMTVYKNDEAVLTANNEGVGAVNLHATTYLIIGDNSRFENYGDDRTGCFFIKNN